MCIGGSGRIWRPLSCRSREDESTRAVAYDRRSALGGLLKAARVLAPDVLVAYDEQMNTAQPGELYRFLLRRGIREIARQFRTGGRAHAWLRRIVHPAEAEIPIRPGSHRPGVLPPVTGADQYLQPWKRRLPPVSRALRSSYPAATVQDCSPKCCRRFWRNSPRAK